MNEDDLPNFSRELAIKWRTLFDQEKHVLYRRFEGRPIFVPEGTTVDFLTTADSENRAAIERAILHFSRHWDWPASITPIQSFLLRRRLQAGFEWMLYLESRSFSDETARVALEKMPPLDKKQRLFEFIMINLWVPEAEPNLLLSAAKDLDAQRPSRND